VISSKAKSLLIGASGQLGAQMYHLLGPDRCLVSSRRAAQPGQIPLDLAALATVDDAERALDTHSLDVIYCIAGMTAVDACEDTPELAHNINCRGPEMLAHIATRRNIPFVYFSTEYVFDGIDGPYAETDPTNPLSVYGRSKLEGEQRILDTHPNPLILRTTVVYGPDRQRKNFLYTLKRLLASGQTMRVPIDQISTPTCNEDLAQAAVELVDSKTSGIIHACGPDLLSRFDFALQAAQILGLDASLVQGVTTAELSQKAPRPLNAGMITDRLRQTLRNTRMRTNAEAIEAWSQHDKHN
jgi:dTDP-4-dehydrorhamnose reductase